MAASPKWQFKSKFRTNVYGWRGSKLAITRLKEAVKEIRTAAKSDPVAAGDGCVALMERLWPALQHIDTSSGALGTAVHNTLEELIPLLIAAPADRDTRAKWLERLFDAVQEDGVEYLDPVAERWGEIARYPDLINQYADLLLEPIREAWADRQRYNHVAGSKICLSCLLEAGRYDELRGLLALRRYRFWSDDRFAADALLRQGLWQEAIAYAEASRSKINGAFSDHAIDRYCEDTRIVDKHPLTRRVALPHDRRQPRRPHTVVLAEGGIAVAIRMPTPVLLPQQRQRHARALQFTVDHRPVRLGKLPPLQRDLREKPALKSRLINAIGQRPRQTRRLCPVQVVPDTAAANPETGRNPPPRQPRRIKPQYICDLPH